MDKQGSGSPVEQLYAEHARFLAFIERRTGSRALAEEILQDAYVLTEFCGSCASGGCRDCGCGKPFGN